MDVQTEPWLTFAVAGVPRRRSQCRVERCASQATPLRSDRPTDGWGRPWSARDLDAKLASFVSERGSINTGHVPLPLAVGAAAGALTGGVPHPSSPLGVGLGLISCSAGTGPGLLGC